MLTGGILRGQTYGFRLARPSTDNTGVNLAVELQKAYDSEINIAIFWLWVGGIDVRLGDKMNGFDAEGHVAAVAEIVRGLAEAIAHFYPTSDYASPDWKSGNAARNASSALQ